MKIYNIVKEYPELMDALIKESPKFKKLKNKVVFNTMAKMTNVYDAAKIGNLEVDDLLLALNKNIGKENEYKQLRDKILSKDNSFNIDVNEENNEIKQWFKIKDQFRVIDVRDKGDDTFSTIMDEIEGINIGEGICVIQQFEPTPLYKALTKRGFEYITDKISDEEYRSYFYKER